MGKAAMDPDLLTVGDLADPSVCSEISRLVIKH